MSEPAVNPFAAPPADKPSSEAAPVVDLFTPEVPDAEADVAEEPAVALFEEPAAAEPAEGTPVPYNAFLKRVGKLTGQRNELRRQVDEVNAKLAATDSKLADSDRIAATVREKYSRWPNVDPAAAFAADADYLDAFETLSQKHPEVAKAVEIVRQHLNQGGQKPVSEPIKPAPAATPAPATDPSVAKLIQQNARQTVASVLTANGVKPAFRNIIANHVAATLAVPALADLTPAAVLKHAKEYILANGLSAAEVLAPKEEEKPAAPKKVASTSTGRAKVAPATLTAPGEKPDATAAPKTRDEWQAGRSARIQQIIGDLTSAE